jgi:tRNA(fMet)-specific endonuclease VapC
MTLYILDTDHITLLQHGHPILLARLAALPSENIAVTVVVNKMLNSGKLQCIPLESRL